MSFKKKNLERLGKDDLKEVWKNIKQAGLGGQWSIYGKKEKTERCKEGQSQRDLDSEGNGRTTEELHSQNAYHTVVL